MLDSDNPSQQPMKHIPNFLAGGGEMGALIRSHDWSISALGPVDTWPQSLRTALRIMLTSRQPIWVGWGEQLVYFYNDAYKSIIGKKHPWALGRPTAEVWREIWEDIGPMLDTAMGGVEGTYVEEQLLIMERNGYPEETYYTFSYSPIPDDDGTPGGIICANTEDTSKVLGERQLALLRELAARTVDTRSWHEACWESAQALATDAHDLPFALLYITNDDGNRLQLAASSGLAAGGAASPESIRLDGGTQWPVAEVLRTHQPLIVDNLTDRFGSSLPSGPWSRPPSSAAILAIPSSSETGRSGILIVGLNPYRLFDDSYRGFLSLVSSQIAAAIANADAYQEERRRAEALAELDRAKTAFFSNVSHEFRTPLTLMLGPLEETLADPTVPETSRANIELAHRNGNRLLRLVNSLLDFSRIEAGRVQATFRPTDLSQLTAEIASTFRSTVERAGMRLEIACPPLPKPVYLDRETWEKVILNLLSNAFKFTFEGEITVNVAGDPDGRRALVRVRDTGIGIPPTETPRLFERFHRVQGAKGRSFEGSGIGLALVHELVSLNGGAISVESRPDAGTEFTITLPFGRNHLPEGQVTDEAAPASGLELRAEGYVQEALRWLPDGERSDEGLSAIDSGLPGRAKGKRILLADDNADMREYATRLLAAEGYLVNSFPDGATALAHAKLMPPDLVLSDVMMPKLDGFALLRALRAEPQTAAIPVIILSARAGEEARVSGLEAGADDYLTKPFAARELLARVNASIQVAEVRREANRALFASEQRFLMTQDRLSLALSTGRVAVFEWDVESDHLAIQGPLAKVFGIPQHDAEKGLPLADFMAGIATEDRDRVMTAVDESIMTGQPYEAQYRVIGSGTERVVVARGSVEVTDQGGKRMSGVVIDITEAKAAEDAIRESRAYLRELLNATGEGFYAVDRDGNTTLVNRSFLRLLGFGSEAEAVGRKLHDVIHHSRPNGDHYPKEECPIYRAASRGEPAHVEGENFYRLDGTHFPVEYRAYPIWRDGELAGAICTFVDISERVAARHELERNQIDLQEQATALEVISRAAAAVSGDLDLERLVQTITDAAVTVTGAQFGAFFYNVVDQQGERYTLYSLSGVSRDAFARFPMPRNTAVFDPTFSGAGVVRSDDITLDPRYGKSAPYHGMPPGHLPVRSYLAVPVRSRTGEVLGGLFFGHSATGMFGELAEERVLGLASQAAVAMDNARLFQGNTRELEQRRLAEDTLKALNESLEERVANEVAERSKAEEALRQAQKMEAVGQLTGGVAHDFNNLLTIIIGGLETIRRSKPGDTVRIQRAIDMAQQGAQRAASLTGRLLAFSRRQPLDPKPLDLNALVRDMTELLYRTLGEQIELEGVLAPRLWRIEADQNQLESALINLAVNARDAMPEGGKLTIETGNTALDEAYVATDAEVIPGQYVAISVSDTGSGMSRETLSRVFEPFFTTKEVGRGTGLGLSMVYGFVKQSGGHVTIYSEEGEGTTVRMYFPRYLGASAEATDVATPDIPTSSEGEVILLVEDHDDVRAYSSMILNELGYHVIEAAEAEAALAVLATDQRIDLLFTDVVLPGKSGRVLADAAAELRSGLKVLFTTGYSRNAIVHHGRLDAGVQLITKPFTFEQLATRVRDLLDRG